MLAIWIILSKGDVHFRVVWNAEVVSVTAEKTRNSVAMIVRTDIITVLQKLQEVPNGKLFLLWKGITVFLINC